MKMINENDLKQKMNFDFYYKKYELAINRYARELSSKIGKPNEFKDYKQEGKIALFNLYQERLELVNFEPEIYKYKDILKEAKKKGLIIDFNVGVRNPFKNTPDFLLLATKWVKKVLKNDIRDHRRRSCSYDEKTILSNDIDHTSFRAYKSINLYNFNISKISEEDIIHRIDILNILKGIKNSNAKKSFIYKCEGYNGYEISKILGISPQAVYKNINQIKKILNLYYYEMI